MDWKGLEGRKFFFRTKNNKVYTGYVTEVDVSDNTIIFISILDKFNKSVTLVHSELVEFKEEQ